MAAESGRTRFLSQMVCFKHDPHDDFATFWRKLHRRGHEIAETFAVSPVDMYRRAEHRLAGHCPFRERQPCESDDGVQEFGMVASGPTRMVQDQDWRCSTTTL